MLRIFQAEYQIIESYIEKGTESYRGSPSNLQWNVDQCMSVKKLPEAMERSARMQQRKQSLQQTQGPLGMAVCHQPERKNLLIHRVLVESSGDIAFVVGQIYPSITGCFLLTKKA